VAFRDDDGSVRVLDAHCAHLGANMARGGRIVDGTLECPFHGWRWNGSGQNTCIPYSEGVNRAQRVPVWTTAEVDGLLYVWHGDSPTPEWSVPSINTVIEAAGFADPSLGADTDDGRRTWAAARLFPQFITENLVDIAHFHWVHSARGPSILHRYEDEGPFFSVHHQFPGAGDTRLMIQASGVGIQTGVFSRGGALEFVEVTTATPVDDETSDLRGSIWMVRDRSMPLSPEQLEQIEEQHTEFSRDIVIWEHLRYVSRPPFVREEARAFKALRKWARQFYGVENVEVSAAHVTPQAS
jgi:3-ketosteroid 9alpha-monooxygenase subunit A